MMRPFEGWTDIKSRMIISAGPGMVRLLHQPSTVLLLTPHLVANHCRPLGMVESQDLSWGLLMDESMRRILDQV